MSPLPPKLDDHGNAPAESFSGRLPNAVSDHDDGQLEPPAAITVAGEVPTVSPPANTQTPDPSAELDATISDAPPDGGLTAWLQVAASFALYFNHLGLINSFGVFQAYYTTALPHVSASSVSWIGSLQVFCLMALSVVAGPLYDMGHCRALVLVGTVLVVAGLALVSLASQYWHILLAQGFCVGLGACCLSVPSIAIVPMYFRRRRRARAMALATVGSGLGATLYPLVFENARARWGFAWATRLMALMALVLCVFALVVIRPLPVTRPPRWRGEQAGGIAAGRHGGFSLRWLIDSSAFRETPFLIYCVAIFFNNIAFFNSPYYLVPYAGTHGMRDHPLLHYLLAILNACSIPGRIIPSFFADRFGALDTFVVVCACTGIAVFYWISAVTAAGNIAFAVLYGFFSGGVVMLATVVLASITPDIARMGTRLGMVSVLKGIASLVGPPISGAILGSTHSYLGIQLFAAFCMMLTAVFSTVLQVVLARRAMAKQA